MNRNLVKEILSLKTKMCFEFVNNRAQPFMNRSSQFPYKLWTGNRRHHVNLTFMELNEARRELLK